MILVDTSAWVEFLRDTGSPTCVRVDELLEADIATCHPIRMEVLAGARDDRQLNELRRLLARASIVPVRAMDYEEAAALFRVCRRSGETVRKLIDCCTRSRRRINGDAALTGYCYSGRRVFCVMYYDTRIPC